MFELYCSNLYTVCTMLKTIPWRLFYCLQLELNVHSMWMSLSYDDFWFQKLNPVRIEEISRYFLFGFLSLVDLLRLLSSWTLGLGSGGFGSWDFWDGFNIIANPYRSSGHTISILLHQSLILPYNQFWNITCTLNVGTFLSSTIHSAIQTWALHINFRH